MTNRLLFLAAFATLIARDARGQWAVFDSASFGQALATAQSTARQVEQLRASYEQLQTTYRALSGSRGLGGVLYNPALRQYLPPAWARVYDAASAGGYPGISGTFRQIAAAEQLTGSVGEQQASIVARGRRTAVADKAVGLQAYAGARDRLAQTESLMQEANRTQDPKAIQEVQARIAVEQAVLQQESTKLQLVAMLQRAEEKLVEQQKNDLAQRILSSANTGMPACCSSRWP